jgi:hypothetical protein
MTRSDTTLTAVEKACADLLSAGQPVTFTNVARLSGTSRPALYRNPSLRAVIEDHRAQHHEPRTLTALSAEVAHLRTALEALSERVRNQEDRIRRLEHTPRQKASNQ